MELIIDVDAREDKVKGTLVRCGSCKQAEPCQDQELAQGHVWCRHFDFPVEKAWYCADGERR